MIRGDGSVGHCSYQRPPGTGGGDVHRFRLARADPDGLARAAGYLAGAGIPCTEFTFAEAAGARRRMTAIRASGRDQVLAVEQLIAWPPQPTLDWRKGFLAGIFDAEGSYSGTLRIANTDPEIIGWTTSCLTGLGFRHVVERLPEPERAGLHPAARRAP